MKSLSRIVTAIVATVAALFAVTPAFAAEDVEKIDTLAPYSAAGQPVDWVATLIVGAILLIVVLGLAQLVGNLFEKKDA